MYDEERAEKVPMTRDTALSQLDERLTELDQAVDQLEKSLVAVLRADDMEQAAGPMLRNVGESPLADRAMKAFEIRQKVTNILQRLDI